jgi:amidohydrolase
LTPKVTASEDFSAYQKVIPGFFFYLGVKPADLPPEKTGSNHSPLFVVDEAQLKTGVRALTHLTLDYLRGK